MSLPTLPKVQQLQETLHAKAKGSPNFRFYSLYDKVYRADVLWVAYRRCCLNDGAPGSDGQTFDDIVAYGASRWLDELAEELRAKNYRRSRSGGSGYPNRTASRDRWAFPRSRIVSCRWLPCWSWSRSSRPICNRSNTRTDRVKAGWTLSGTFTR